MGAHIIAYGSMVKRPDWLAAPRPPEETDMSQDDLPETITTGSKATWLDVALQLNNVRCDQ
jgi:hypothetical protein